MGMYIQIPQKICPSVDPSVFEHMSHEVLQAVARVKRSCKISVAIKLKSLHGLNHSL